MDSITPDQVIIWKWGVVSINSTICYTWAVMTLLGLSSWLVTRRLSSSVELSRWQNVLEMVICFIQSQIREITHREPKKYLPFIGSLFLFIALSNLLDVVPGFHAPTASLSTTAALAICVLLAVPVFGIADRGFLAYVRHYVSPSVFMLPFNILGEISRTLALAVRLFGNVMSGGKLAAILLAVAPLFFPVIMNLLGLLTGLIQAYIFAVLAMVYIASAGHGGGDATSDKAQQSTAKGEQDHG
ncbi:MAG: F0F1 ATP synthase subunit A [Desulfomonile tiedjei]|nr:F0F1 ATP synthase subunit A [Desulfomonile tiedjei]